MRDIMEIFNVGKEENKRYYDEVHELSYQLKNLKFEYKWFVYAYYQGSYCGGGEGVGCTEEGELHRYDFSHCSCYGAIDDGNTYEVIHSSEFTGPEVLTSVQDNGVLEKVRELCENSGKS